MLNKKDIKKSYSYNVDGEREIQIIVGDTILLNISQDGRRFWIPGGHFKKGKVSNEAILRNRPLIKAHKKTQAKS